MLNLYIYIYIYYAIIILRNVWPVSHCLFQFGVTCDAELCSRNPQLVKHWNQTGVLVVSV